MPATGPVTHEENDRVPEDSVWTQHYLPSSDGSGTELHADVLQGLSNLSGADWRFRLVAVSPNFSVRYSTPFAPGQTANFSLQSGETHMMLVVAATPSQHRNYPLWQTGVGDPFPYQLTIQGASPA